MPLHDLPGNPEARTALLRALGGGRFPHALLLHGPAGTGKRRAALAVAQALLCARPTPDACGRCRACLRITQGNHPDVTTIERRGQFIPVEVARELVRSSYLRPFEARAKVYLVLEAEALNEDSGNTLLKTLEEPPASTYLVLVTSNREAMLPTLRSRCQALPFRSLGRAELVSILAAEHGVAPADARLRAGFAAGSLEAALALDLEQVRRLGGELLALLGELGRGRLRPDAVESLLRLAEGAARKDDDADTLFLPCLRAVARDALVRAAGGATPLLLVAEHHDALAAVAAALGIAGAAALLEDIDRAERDLKFNANRKLLVEALLVGVYERAAA